MGCWSGLGRPGYRVQQRHRVYACRAPSDGPRETLRLAEPKDTEQLAHMHHQLLIEDLQMPPERLDPQRHRELVERRIAAGSTLVVARGSELLFCGDVGTQRAQGAQVGGIFVPIQHRGQGIATRAMRALCQRLLAELPCVTLHVNETNAPAVRCYVRSGFEATTPYCLMTL